MEFSGNNMGFQEDSEEFSQSMNGAFREVSMCIRRFLRVVWGFMELHQGT